MRTVETDGALCLTAVPSKCMLSLHSSAYPCLPGSRDMSQIHFQILIYKLLMCTKLQCGSHRSTEICVWLPFPPDWQQLSSVIIASEHFFIYLHLNIKYHCILGILYNGFMLFRGELAKSTLVHYPTMAEIKHRFFCTLFSLNHNFHNQSMQTTQTICISEKVGFLRTYSKFGLNSLHLILLCMSYTLITTENRVNALQSMEACWGKQSRDSQCDAVTAIWAQMRYHTNRRMWPALKWQRMEQ